MEYLLFIATDTEPDTSPDDDPDIYAWVAEGERRGIRLRGDALRDHFDPHMKTVTAG